MNIDQQNGVKIYSIYGDYSQVNLPAFSRYIIDCVDFLTYWNNLPLLFIVKTKLNVREVTLKCQPFFVSGHFLVAEINPLAVDGVLPMAAWQWFTTPAPPQKRPTQNFDVAALLALNPPKP